MDNVLPKYRICVADYSEGEIPGREVELLLRRALGHTRGEFGTDYVWDEIEHKRLRLLLVMDAHFICGILVVRLAVWPNKRVLWVLGMAGEKFDEWGGLANKTLRKWAEELQADMIQCSGRSGLEKLLAPLGWQKYSINMVLDLNVQR